ncbi:MAG: hypothetical protein RLZZ584_3418 [Pseudomonadota bacterium]
MKRLLTLICLLFFAQFALAELPTQAEVEAAVRASRYSEAEAMMAQVVKARPESAKARYVYAEILAHNRQYEPAAAQLREARRIDPATKFADPAHVQAFEAQLERAVAKARQPGSLAGTGAVIGGTPQAQPPARTGAPSTAPLRSQADASTRPARAEADDGVPNWLLLVGLFIVGGLILRAFMKRQRARQAPVYQGAAPGWNGGAGMGHGHGEGYPGGGPYGAPGAGSSALRTGMAVAGGVAAGVLLERMLHGNEARAAEPPPAQLDPQPYRGTDDESGFERREIDFGNGGGWDGGASDAGGNDAGGGGGDGW